MKLAPLCGRCSFDSPNLILEPICASKVQAWTAFRCKTCGVRGLFATMLRMPGTELYRWTPDSGIVRLYLHRKLKD